MAYFSGKVSRVMFEKKTQGFYILHMILDGKKVEAGSFSTNTVTVKGYVPGITVEQGSWFGFEAKWVDDPKYGRQLQVTRAPVFKDYVDPDAVTSLLVGDGVTPIVARSLKLRFGNQLSEALKSISSIEEGLGVSHFEAEFLVERWKQIQGRLRALDFLNNLNLPRSKVGEIWATYGDQTEEILATNPWALVEIGGIPFSKLDELAVQQGLPKDTPERCDGVLIHISRWKRSQGDLFITTRGLLREASKIAPQFGARQFAEAIQRCVESEKVVLDTQTRPGTKGIYDPWFHHLEERSAELLSRRVRSAVDCGVEVGRLSDVGPQTNQLVADQAPTKEILWASIREAASLGGITLSEDQAQGVYNAMTCPVSILTGLPGTGKSTSMNVLVRLLRAASIPFVMLAPTGIAAKRLSTVANSPAFTIHRGLGAKGVTEKEERKSTYAGIVGESKQQAGSGGRGEVWGCNEEHPHMAEMVIVDEFSMVDQHVLFRLLSGTMPFARLVFVGDAAQLPSVGSGNVLRDMISSGRFPVVALTQIFRQEDTSDIVHAAHAIYAGNTPKTQRNSDFVLLQMSQEERVLEVILRLVGKLYTRAQEWSVEDGTPQPSFQVLSPRHMGTLGVTNLNARIRSMVNPKNNRSISIKMGSMDVREGDRVMIVKNNYDLGVFNGDIGKIIRINRRSKEVKVKIQEEIPRIVTFNFYAASSHLRLAYACTVHKYQGLEIGTIIFPVVMGFGRQLQRNLLYTAITRARVKVFLVGTPRALEKAVENNQEDLRNTMFIERLHKQFETSEVEVVPVLQSQIA
jgi:exodeoxyribonuclease V alpha subunit